MAPFEATLSVRRFGRVLNVLRQLPRSVLAIAVAVPDLDTLLAVRRRWNSRKQATAGGSS